MKSRRTRVCRWCKQPLPDWSDIWPVQPGVYLFYGYPTNKMVDFSPRPVLVTVEMGPVYRTSRARISRSTGAAGYFMPLLVPEVWPDEGKLEKMGEQGAALMRRLRRKGLKASLSEEFK